MSLFNIFNKKTPKPVVETPKPVVETLELTEEKLLLNDNDHLENFDKSCTILNEFIKCVFFDSVIYKPISTIDFDLLISIKPLIKDNNDKWSTDRFNYGFKYIVYTPINKCAFYSRENAGKYADKMTELLMNAKNQLINK